MILSNTRNFVLHSFHIVKKNLFCFQHFHSFLYRNLIFFLRTLRFFFSSENFTITNLTLDIFFSLLHFKKNFANVNPRTLEKFTSFEIVIHSFFSLILRKLNTQNYSKQYNRIHRYKIHIHTHTLVEKNIELQTLN